MTLLQDPPAPDGDVTEEVAEPLGDAGSTTTGRDRRILAATTIVAGAIAGASSLWQLTRKPLWIDEAISLGATHQLVPTIRATGATMALYYLLLDGWTALFGTSLAAVRSLSVLIVVAAVVTTSLVARRLVRPAEAAVAVLTLASMAPLVRMGQDARAYGLVMLVTVGCWGCLARALEAEDADPGGRASQRWFLGLAVLVGLGVASHGLFILQVVPVLASVALLPRRRALAVRLVPAAVVGALAMGGVLALGASDVGSWIPALSRAQGASFVRILVTEVRWANVVLLGLALAGTVALVARARRAGPLDRWRALVPVAWALAAPLELLVLSIVRPTFLGRYAQASVPGLALLVGVGAVALVRSAARPAGPGLRRPVQVGGGLVVAALLVSALVAGRDARTRLRYEDWDAVVARVADDVQPGDAIVFPSAGADAPHRNTARPPFEAAWARADPEITPVVLTPDRPLGEVRRFDPLPPLDEVSRAMGDHPRVWAVEFPGFHRSLRALLAEPAAAAFVPVERWTFDGGMRVYLLERRG